MYQNLTEQRYQRASSSMTQIFNRFSDVVKPYLLKGMQHVELNDGCLGRCSWCAVDVTRKITKGVDIEDWMEFASNYIQEMPDTVSLYWRTDPLDIAGFDSSGQPYDYSDLLAATIPLLRNDQTIYTSTVIPAGTEEVAERTIYTIWHAFLDNFRTGNTYVENGEKVSRINTLRFSQTEKNAPYITSLEQQLRTKIGGGFLDAIFGRNEGREMDEIQYQGNFINHPNRNPLSDDLIPIACYDGTLLTTDGLFAVIFDLATKSNPFGYHKIELDPTSDTLGIARHVKVNDYFPRPLMDLLEDGICPPLLPPTIIDYVDTTSGEVIETQELDSVNRIGHAFYKAYRMLLSTKYTLDTEKPNVQKALVEFGTQLEQRNAAIDTLDQSDQEGLNFAQYYFTESTKLLEELVQ